MKINGIYNGDITLGDPIGSDELNEPVTVADAKSWSRIDVDEDDDIIEALITGARQQLEGYLNISLVPREIIATIYCQLGNYPLPYGPVTTVTSFKYTGETDELTDYTLRGDLFKSIVEEFCEPLRIVYNAGYDILPKHFYNALKQQILYLYDNRGDTEAMSEISPVTLSLIKPYRRVI